MELRHLTPEEHACATDVKFSPNGKRLAWCQTTLEGHFLEEWVLVVHEMQAGGSLKRWTDDWDRFPISIYVSSNGNDISE